MNSPRHNPTINDVARHAGVSRATASRAIGGYGRISPTTVAKVMESAQTLGYRPNEVARAMRAGTTKTIGLVIVADFTNAFFDRATKGIVDAARANGYQVLISNTDEDTSFEKQAVETLIEKRVDGLIVVPSSPTAAEHLSPRALNGRPLVLIDRLVKGLQCSTVTTDDRAGARVAVENVIQRGHRKLAFLVASSHAEGIASVPPPTLISTVADRVQGFAEGVQNGADQAVTAQWRFVREIPGEAKQAVEELLESHNPPTVIITSNNDMALAVLTVAGARGLTIGRDISLVTVDDSPWAQAMAPGLTVVSRPVELLANVAVRQLLEEINQPGTSPTSVVLPTDFTVRGSVANLN